MLTLDVAVGLLVIIDTEILRCASGLVLELLGSITGVSKVAFRSESVSVELESLVASNTAEEKLRSGVGVASANRGDPATEDVEDAIRFALSVGLGDSLDGGVVTMSLRLMLELELELRDSVGERYVPFRDVSTTASPELTSATSSTIAAGAVDPVNVVLG